MRSVRELLELMLRHSEEPDFNSPYEMDRRCIHCYQCKLDKDQIEHDADCPVHDLEHYLGLTKNPNQLELL